ncbi:MAG: hypothetical protein AAFU66_09045, partial [Pseudomonadota bacterium]
MRAPVVSLRAVAQIVRRGGGLRQRGQLLMLLERPDHVRMDLMSPFGPIATLTTDGRRFSLFDRRKGAFFEGGSCPANIARLLGVGLTDDEVVRLLLALPIR